LSRTFAKVALIGGMLAFAFTPAAAEAGPPKGKTPPKSCKKQKKQKKCQPAIVQGRMTGHGHEFNVTDGNGVTWNKVQWEFRNTVCNEARFPDLKVEFGGNRFILTSYTSGPTCVQRYGTGAEGQPKAGFDTFWGSGTGTLNGVAGASATFEFTDLGEPGRGDLAKFTIFAPNGSIAYTGGALDGGNHQAHRK